MGGQNSEGEVIDEETYDLTDDSEAFAREKDVESAVNDGVSGDDDDFLEDGSVARENEKEEMITQGGSEVTDAVEREGFACSSDHDDEREEKDEITDRVDSSDVEIGSSIMEESPVPHPEGAEDDDDNDEDGGCDDVDARGVADYSEVRKANDRS